MKYFGNIFDIGNEVCVSHDVLKKYGEWEGVRLWIVGINLRSYGLEYTVTEQWPPFGSPSLSSPSLTTFIDTDLELVTDETPSMSVRTTDDQP